MIYINTAKEQTGCNKVLREGDNFTAWRVDNDLQVETTLPDTTARKVLIRKAATMLGVNYEQNRTPH